MKSKTEKTWASKAQQKLESLAALAYPRRCPLCGELLDPTARHESASCLCAACLPRAKALEHKPPRLPETEHCFYALSGAASGYYYQDEIRAAILHCKLYGAPSRARELADLAAVRVFGAVAAEKPGRRPIYESLSGIPVATLVVPVPPRRKSMFTPSVPYLLGRRLAAVLDIPLAQPLQTTRAIKEQKTLTRDERLQNTRGAYRAAPKTDLSGERILLVDDVITTGSTVSACAQALMEAGAFDVFAVSVAAAEEHKSK